MEQKQLDRDDLIEALAGIAEELLAVINGENNIVGTDERLDLLYESIVAMVNDATEENE